MITGESIPIEVTVGDSGPSGQTLNASGRLVIEAAAVGADTALARITSLVEKRSSGQSADSALG